MKDKKKVPYSSRYKKLDPGRLAIHQSKIKSGQRYYVTQNIRRMKTDPKYNMTKNSSEVKLSGTLSKKEDPNANHPKSVTKSQMPTQGPLISRYTKVMDFPQQEQEEEKNIFVGEKK